VQEYDLVQVQTDILNSTIFNVGIDQQITPEMKTKTVDVLEELIKEKEDVEL
jgi:hypothetical protein